MPCCDVVKLYSVVRSSMEVFSISSDGMVSNDWCELDSHADTCVAGANFVTLYETGESVNVHSFTPEQSPLHEIKIGSAATAYACEDGEIVVLVVNQALLFGDRLPNSLINPNQLRAYGHVVEDTPRQFNSESTHSISILGEGGFVIPLELKGVISCFISHKPTDHELETCRRIVLTSDQPWNPNDLSFAEQEEAVALHLSAVHQNGDSRIEILPMPAELCDEADFASRLISQISISSDDIEGDGLDGRNDDGLFNTPPEFKVISAMEVSEKSSVITKEVLARRWGIGLDTALRTLRVTTQRGIRSFVHPTDRRLPTHKPHLSFPMIRKKFYTDTMFSKITSLRKNKCAQVWTDGSGYSLFYPLATKASAYLTISRMVHDVQGIPEVIVSDGAREETGRQWKEEINRIRSRHHVTEPYSQWQNKAEAEIREIKRSIRRQTLRANSPKRLWDHCGQWIVAIRRFTAHSYPELDGMTPYERVHARTGDISAYAQFDWYQYVWYIDPVPRDAAQSKRKIGRWIGVAEDIGGPLTYLILPASAIPVPRSSVFPVTTAEMMSDEVKQLMMELDKGINDHIGDERTDQQIRQEMPDLPELPNDIFDEEFDEEFDDSIDVGDGDKAPEADEQPSPDAYDQYLAMNVLIGRGGEAERGTVKRRAHDSFGNPIGKSNPNPILDTREYEVEFPDGTVDILTANTIAESMYSQVDAEGQEYSLLDAIIDHRSDGNVLKSDDALLPNSRTFRRTTKGWKLLVNWKDGTSDWISLADLKESYPVQVAEYAVNNKIASEPAFAWWVPHVLKKRERIIKKVKSRHLRRTHKFGIEIPNTAEQALEIDQRTGTTFWRDAIEKELRNVRPALDIRDDLTVGPPGFKEIRCHLIFDVKAETLLGRLVLLLVGI